MFLFQLNTSAFLQTIGLVFIQSLVTAPIYGLAVYWGILMANKRVDKQIQKSNQMENNK